MIVVGVVGLYLVLAILTMLAYAKWHMVRYGADSFDPNGKLTKVLIRLPPRQIVETAPDHAEGVYELSLGGQSSLEVPVAPTTAEMLGAFRQLEFDLNEIRELVWTLKMVRGSMHGSNVEGYSLAEETWITAIAGLRQEGWKSRRDLIQATKWGPTRAMAKSILAAYSDMTSEEWKVSIAPYSGKPSGSGASRELDYLQSWTPAAGSKPS